jgi:hypothetical protein
MKRKVKVILVVVALIASVFTTYVLVQYYDFNKYYTMLGNEDTSKEAYKYFLQNRKMTVYNLLSKLQYEEENPIIRHQVLILLRAMNCKQCEEGYLGLLDDPDWRMRIFVLDALGEIGMKGYNELLKEIINDERREINLKISAVMNLGKYGGKEELKYLEKLIDEFPEDENKINIAIQNSIAKLQL